MKLITAAEVSAANEYGSAFIKRHVNGKDYTFVVLYIGEGLYSLEEGNTVTVLSLGSGVTGIVKAANWYLANTEHNGHKQTARLAK